MLQIYKKNKGEYRKMTGKKIEVVAGLIMCNNQVLIGQRKRGKDLEYKWEFPGGKLEQGETCKECLCRELMEEMQLPIIVGDYFMSSAYNYDFVTILMHVYWASTTTQKVPELFEHEQYKWVNITDLGKYDFAPADKPIINSLIKKTAV